MNVKFDELPIIPGTKVIYHNRVCEILSSLTLDQVMLKAIDDGHTFAAKISHIRSLGKDKNTAVIKDDTVLFDASAWEVAKDREKIIAELATNTCSRKDAKIAARKLNISERQIYTRIKPWA